MKLKSFLIAFFLIVVFAFQAEAKKLFVDKILATVGKSTITAENIECERKIIKITDDSLLYPGQGKTMTDEQVFQELVIRELIYGQALKLGFDKFDEKQEKELLDKLEGKFPSRDAYLKFLLSIEYSDPRFDEKMKQNKEWPYYYPIYRRLRKVKMIQVFVDKKIGLQVRLSLMGEFDRMKGELASENPGKSDEELKKVLEKKLFLERLRDYIDDVMTRTDVSVMDDRYKNSLN